MSNRLFFLNPLDRSISNRRDVGSVFIIAMFIEIPVFNANNIDPDQVPRSAASDLDLHSLLPSLLRATRHKWVNSP